MAKPYTVRSITGAQARVRQLVKQIEERDKLLTRWAGERAMLAKLAADGPAFSNPLDAAAAIAVRDDILYRLKLNPDGSYRK